MRTLSDPTPLVLVMVGLPARGKTFLARKVVRQPARVTIRKQPTGVRGLDEILGGGLPEFSFNIIAGTPGCGKTTSRSRR